MYQARFSIISIKGDVDETRFTNTFSRWKELTFSRLLTKPGPNRQVQSVSSWNQGEAQRNNAFPEQTVR
jgi:hypothetical protein